MVQQPPPWGPHDQPRHEPTQPWAPPAKPPHPTGPAAGQQPTPHGWHPHPPPPPPPAWNPDPYGIASARYWDGTRWTEHTNSPARAVATPAYRSLTIPARLLLVALAVTTVLCVVAAVSDWVAADLLSRLQANEALVSQAEADATDLRQGGIWLLQILLRLLTATAFIIWFHRAYRNLAGLGARSLRFSTGWAIGAWFVPLLNLVRPKQLMDDIWRASDPVLAGQTGEAWKQRRVSRLVHAWWAAFIGANLAASVAGNLTPIFSDAIDPEQLLYATQAYMVADLLLVPSALFAYVLVRQVTQREEHAAARVAHGRPA
jgi:hypothetical protein